MAAAGADEFYCSVVPEDWAKRFKTSAISRRAFGNLPSYENLAQAIDSAHELGKTLSLVMNAQHYTSEQLECLLELAGKFDRLGGDAVIVGDESLLYLIACQGFGFDLHVSSIASCRNREAAEFHQDLGATRVIFPRDMNLREIERVASAVPDLEFEAFVLNDGCVFEEGVCHTIHLPGQLGGPICLDDYQHQYQRVDGQPLSMSEQAALEENDRHYQQWLWYRFGCGFSVTESGYPYGPCGLCALPRFFARGITSLKIAGRDAPTERKVKSVQMVSRVRDRLRQGAAETIAFAQNMRKQPQHCEAGYMCYYPEVLKDRAPDSIIARCS